MVHSLNSLLCKQETIFKSDLTNLKLVNNFKIMK